jgi:DNA adenine methylase
MRFQGGKARQAKAIGELLKTVDRPNYLEPFVGGAWILKEVATHFPKVIATDLHLDLILLYQALQTGWEPPQDLSEQEYQDQRRAEPSALRAFAGYGCSFGGRWFGGYAREQGRNFAGNAATSLTNLSVMLDNVLVECCDYAAHSPSSSTVVYCDPPYIGRTPLTQLPPFDHSRFWQAMDAWVDNGALVFVSEERAPSHWIRVLAPNRQTNLGLYNERPTIGDYVFCRQDQL